MGNDTIEKEVVEVMETTAEMAVEEAKEGKIGAAGIALVTLAGFGLYFVGSKVVSYAKKGINKITDAKEAKLAKQIAYEVASDEDTDDEEVEG